MKTNLKQGRRLAVASLGLSLLAAGIAVPGAYAEEAPAPTPNTVAPAPAQEDKADVIKDAALKACINEKLGRADKEEDITKTDLKGLTELKCGVDPKTKMTVKNANRIESLAGLENAENLVTIDLSATSVKDYGPIAKLKKLTQVELSCFGNVDQLRKLPNWKTFQAPKAKKCEKIIEATKLVEFSDISDYPFKAEIEWMAKERISTGYDDGTFRPTENVSRAAMAAFIYRLEGSPKVNLDIESPFVDIDPSTPFYKEICWLAQQEIAKGYADKTFRPWDSISREAMAAFLHRYDDKSKDGKVTVGKAKKFTDTKDSLFKADIQWLANARITNGYADGTFRPDQPIERGAVATFFYRMKNFR